LDAKKKSRIKATFKSEAKFVKRYIVIRNTEQCYQIGDIKEGEEASSSLQGAMV
jgi:hypothetical protein